MKTNAMRILDTLGIHYEIREYEVDPDDLNAERVAERHRIAARAGVQDAGGPR